MAGALTRGFKALIPCLVLALVVGLVPLIGLSGCSRTSTAKERISAPTIAAARSLQEVAPPAAVTQLKTALDRHQPAVTIQAPADGSLLPTGAWSLEIDVRDWPLVDAGPLGLGPHLVVQIDDQPPIRTTTATRSNGQTDISKVRLSLDPLTPGSHRITAYAARPWGEAVKAPAASSQITVHRVAPTPLTQPRSGEAQLRPVSPPTLSASEPVLIDWLLWDAPLQHLREDDTRWRLRVTVNGDSFQVDRQLPLWLKGFRAGSNAVVLELLDGLGEPIAPTLNTLVQEVILRPGERPVWNGQALSAEQLAILLGETPTSPAAPASAAKERATATPSGPAPSGPAAPPANAAAAAPRPWAAGEAATASDEEEPPRTGAAAASPQAQAPERLNLDPEPEGGMPPGREPEEPAETDTPAPAATPKTNAATSRSGAGNDPDPGHDASPEPGGTVAGSAPVAAAEAVNGLKPAASDAATERPPARSQAPAASPPARAASESVGAQTLAIDDDPNKAPDKAPENDTDTEHAIDKDIASPEAAKPSAATDDAPAPPKPTSGLPSARSELNADGTLIRPRKQGLFSGLRGGAA